jgi:hypothetical protein
LILAILFGIGFLGVVIGIPFAAIHTKTVSEQQPFNETVPNRVIEDTNLVQATFQEQN